MHGGVIPPRQKFCWEIFKVCNSVVRQIALDFCVLGEKLGASEKQTAYKVVGVIDAHNLSKKLHVSYLEVLPDTLESLEPRPFFCNF